MQPFFGSIVSDEQGWRTVLVAFPLICLAIWGFNAFSLNRLKKGKTDYSKEGFRRRGRLLTVVLAAVIILGSILLNLIFD